MVKNERLKKILAAALAVTVLTMGAPSLVFADDMPAKTDDKYTNTESEINPDMRTAADTAVTEAGKAELAAEVASKAADAAEAAVKNAEGIAQAGTDIAGTADENADKAVTTHNEGAAYVGTQEGKIAGDVDTAVAAIEAQKKIAETAQEAAEANAKEAAEAKALAMAAKTEAEAKKAASNAEAAAKNAQVAADNAQTAYKTAEKTLTDAQAAYDKAVADAKAEIEKYNNKVESFQSAVNTAELVAVKAAYDKAVADANKAKADAEAARKDAQTAQDAAEIAANATMNFYVNPAQEVYNAKAEAQAAAQSALDQANASQNEAQAAYDGIVAGTTASAKAAQDRVVAEKKVDLDSKQAEVDAKQQQIDNLEWYEYGALLWLEPQLLILKGERNEAEDAYNSAKAESTYNTLIDKALKSTSEYAALTAAQAAAASKQTELDTATQLANEAKGYLDSAENTRDGYLADITNAIDKDAIIKSIADEVTKCVKDVNDTEYDADAYDWATEFYFLWESDRWTAHDIREDLDKKYAGDEWDTLLNFWNLTASSADTDKIIAAAEKAYRQQLLAAEEKLAMSEAYAANSDALAAETNALAKEAAALSSVARLAAAQSKLTAAEETLNAAKEKVKNLTKLQMDVEEAKAKLDAAQTAVDAAKAAAEAAQKAADAAKLDAKAAREAANAIKDVRYFVLINSSILEPTVPTEGKPQPVANYTGLLGTVAVTKPTDEFAVNRTVIIEGTAGTKGMTTDTEAVEKRLKELVFTGNDAPSYEDQMKKVNAGLDAYLATKGLKLAENQYVDWYEFKYESDGWHVDGAIRTKAAQEEPKPEEPAKTYTLTVNYEDEDGNQIWDRKVVEKLENGTAGVEKAELIAGYTPESEELDYAIKDSNAVITFKYKKAAVETTEPDPGPGGTTRRTSRTPVATITDGDVPMADTPVTEIQDEDVALAEEVVIDDEQTPLGKLPKTGGMGAALFFLVGGALVAAGVGARKKED